MFGAIHRPAIVYNYTIGDVPAGFSLEVVHMPAKATEADIENAIRDYIAGERAKVIARRYHIDDKRLLRILHDRGVIRKRSDPIIASAIGQKVAAKLHDKLGLPDAEIASRYMAGETEHGLAQAFGVNRTTIATCLKAAGVERRTTTEAYALRSRKVPLQARPPVLKDHPGPYARDLKTRINSAREFEARAAEGMPARSSEAERLLLAELRARGIAVIPQQAVGPYNVDIGAHPVAVEVWGGAWHFSRDHAERNRYLLDAGWHLLVVYVDKRSSPLTSGAADYVIAFLEEARRNPSIPREYRVIWGSGELFSSGRLDGDNVANIVPRKHFLDTWA
jgi:very-short-patch-repair endonuclease